MVRARPLARALRVGSILLLTGVLAGAGGCTARPSEPTPQEHVRSTVLRYNELLAQGYRALNMSRMREVADELQSEDEYVHMSSLAEGGIRLDSTLKDITFEKVSVETSTASAETKEAWDYRQYDRQTGRLVLEQKAQIYVLAWDLKKQPNGSWLVTDVRAIDVTSSVKPSVVGTISLPSAHP